MEKGGAESYQEIIIMEMDVQKIENVRATYDSEIMNIDGVVSVSTSLNKDGKPCLKIGTSKPVEKIQPFLPAGIYKVNVEIEYQGELKAQ